MTTPAPHPDAASTEAHAHLDQDDAPGYFEVLEIAVRELMIDKGHIHADDIRR